MNSTFAGRVDAGIVWLDVNVPDWLTRVDLNTLDMTDPWCCVVGQLFGDFFADDIHSLDFDRSVAYGFNFPTYFPDSRSWGELTGLWAVRIIELRFERGVSYEPRPEHTE